MINQNTSTLIIPRKVKMLKLKLEQIHKQNCNMELKQNYKVPNNKLGSVKNCLDLLK